MAQLRDGQTGHLVATGSPLALALLADALGMTSGVAKNGATFGLHFDDVGLGFDPDAVRAAHRESVDGLAVALKRADADSADALKAAHERALSVHGAIKKALPAVRKALEASNPEPVEV